MQSPWLVSNILFCYEGETHTGNNSERKQYFVQHREYHINNNEAYTDGSKNIKRKLGFVAVFADITRRGALPEEASFHSAKMTVIKIAIRDTKKRGHEMDNIYTC